MDGLRRKQQQIRQRKRMEERRRQRAKGGAAAAGKVTDEEMRLLKHALRDVEAIKNENLNAAHWLTIRGLVGPDKFDLKGYDTRIKLNTLNLNDYRD